MAALSAQRALVRDKGMSVAVLGHTEVSSVVSLTDQTWYLTRSKRTGASMYAASPSALPSFKHFHDSYPLGTESSSV